MQTFLNVVIADTLFLICSLYFSVDLKKIH
jgi:hypothetical protein